MIFLTSEIVGLVNKDLNDISYALFQEGELINKIVMNGTSDLAVYERFQTGEFSIDEYEFVTPFILESKEFNQIAESYTRYEESFELRIYGFMKHKTDIEKIFNTYTNVENTVNRVVSLGNYRVEKGVGKLQITSEFLPAQDGSNEQRFEGILSFAWGFAEGIVTTDDIIIKIDDVEIPYNAAGINTEKRGTNTIDMTSSGISEHLSSLTGYSVALSLPFLTSNTKLVELFNDIWNKTYNKQYKLTIDIMNVIHFEDMVTLSEGIFIGVKPSILDFDVTLKRVPKSTKVYINDILVPILDFGFTNKAETDAIVKVNEESTVSVFTSSNFGINLVLPLDEDGNNSVIESIMSDTLHGTYGNSYKIRVIRNSIDITYDVILTNGIYNFDINSNGAINVSFTEEDVG